MKKEQFRVETERLVIEPYDSDSFSDLYKLKTLPETHRYNYSQVPTEEELKKYVAEMMEINYEKPKARLELGIRHKKDKRLIGYIGLKGQEFVPDATAEIFYTLHVDYFKQGLGTEAVCGVLNFAFNTLKLHRVWAGATCENIASWRLMEKVGMRRECHWVSDRPKPGKWIPGKGFEKTGQWEDGYGYAILRSEFQF